MAVGARIAVVHGVASSSGREDTLLQVWPPGLRSGLRRTERRLATACAPGRTSVLRLPLACRSSCSPPGRACRERLGLPPAGFSDRFRAFGERNQA
ncbi:MAG: hypothetical protein ACRDYA_00090 [Egibacteraceae bacterium]